MGFQQILEGHTEIRDRRVRSEEKLAQARASFAADPIFGEDANICVFAAGSLGRLDSGVTSDLDVFVTTTGEAAGRLREIQTFASILRINAELGFPQLSNDGQYLKIFNIPENERKIGSANDDNENWFTTRMLLLLESNFLCNETTYHAHKKKILEFYFRDLAHQSGFRPVFLLNDILRYWRTLCLNYEQARSVPGKSWKKRNFNLRFSRMLSVFGTILPLMLIREVTADRIEELSSSTPMERLAQGLDLLVGADDLAKQFATFLDYYESFLATKESIDFDKVTDTVREDLKRKADYVAQFVFRAVNHESVSPEFRRYLVI
jgi:hypothetical protein